MPRSTKSTVKALERLSEASGWPVCQEGRLYHFHTPGVDDPPIPHKAERCLALLWDSLRHQENREELRQAVAYDPGLGKDGKPNVPSRLAAWEIAALQQLAVTTAEDE